MVIRKQQLDTLGQGQFDRFLSHMTESLRAKYPQWCASYDRTPSALHHLVRAAVTDANGFGIEAESDLELYVECLAILSPNFSNDPRFPWAREILHRPNLSGTAKMDLIHDHLVFKRS